MRFLQLFMSIAFTATTAVQAVTLPPGVPRDVSEFRAKHPYDRREAKCDDCRQIVTIRASEHENDDVSQEFKEGVRKANNGGTLHLPEGELFVIGKALDLTGLNDFHLHLDGEIRVHNHALFPSDLIRLVTF